MITEKTHNCKENGRHAAMSEIPERADKDCQDKLKKARVKSYPTIMLPLPIWGAFEAVRPNVDARALQV